MRLLITDCDHPDIEPEIAAARASGIELSTADCSTPEDIIDAGSGVDGLITQYAPVTAAVLEALPQVKAVGRYGVGVDTVDVGAATQRGVAVCNVPDYGTEAVSDHAISLALSIIRDLPGLDRSVRSGAHEGLQEAMPIRQFNSLQFGVVGFGRIGQATARKAAGLGFEVLVSDVALDGGHNTDTGWPVLPLDDLLHRADVLSLHVPLTTDTKHLIDAKALAKLPDQAIVVNTARGGVLDTMALVQALETGHVLGAGLDVFEDEPLSPDHPLTRFERCLLTPHAAFYTEQSYVELKRRAVENVVDVLMGNTPRDIVNPRVLRMS